MALRSPSLQGIIPLANHTVPAEIRAWTAAEPADRTHRTASVPPLATSEQRLPSTRPIDHRWDRSRAIIFNNARPRATASGDGRRAPCDGFAFTAVPLGIGSGNVPSQKRAASFDRPPPSPSAARRTSPPLHRRAMPLTLPTGIGGIALGPSDSQSAERRSGQSREDSRNPKSMSLEHQASIARMQQRHEKEVAALAATLSQKSYGDYQKIARQKEADLLERLNASGSKNAELEALITRAMKDLDRLKEDLAAQSQKMEQLASDRQLDLERLAAEHQLKEEQLVADHQLGSQHLENTLYERHRQDMQAVEEELRKPYEAHKEHALAQVRKDLQGQTAALERDRAQFEQQLESWFAMRTTRDRRSREEADNELAIQAEEHRTEQAVQVAKTVDAHIREFEEALDRKRERNEYSTTRDLWRLAEKTPLSVVGAAAEAATAFDAHVDAWELASAAYRCSILQPLLRSRYPGIDSGIRNFLDACSTEAAAMRGTFVHQVDRLRHDQYHLRALTHQSRAITRILRHTESPRPGEIARLDDTFSRWQFKNRIHRTLYGDESAGTNPYVGLGSHKVADPADDWPSNGAHDRKAVLNHFDYNLRLMGMFGYREVLEAVLYGSAADKELFSSLAVVIDEMKTTASVWAKLRDRSPNRTLTAAIAGEYEEAKRRANQIPGELHALILQRHYILDQLGEPPSDMAMDEYVSALMRKLDSRLARYFWEVPPVPVFREELERHLLDVSSGKYNKSMVERKIRQQAGVLEARALRRSRQAIATHEASHGARKSHGVRKRREKAAAVESTSASSKKTKERRQRRTSEVSRTVRRLQLKPSTPTHAPRNFPAFDHGSTMEDFSQLPLANSQHDVDGQLFVLDRFPSQLKLMDCEGARFSHRSSKSAGDPALLPGVPLLTKDTKSGDGGCAPQAFSPPGHDTARPIMDSTADPLTPLLVEDEKVSFAVSPDEYRAAILAYREGRAAYWSYKLYTNGEGRRPVIYYCANLDQAEARAKEFLDEAVVGFDIEWEVGIPASRMTIKNSVSLIQLACDDKIALLHIALFKGDTAETLLPPSLRRLLESPRISKVGVNIRGDATRIDKWFGTQFRGVFELSRLYRIAMLERDQINWRLVSLAEQVHNVLLLPLRKGAVRTSRWSHKLDMEQSEYAASDAYAAFRLFHTLEARRKAMRPCPPRPAFVEEDAPLVLGDGTTIMRPKKRTVVTSESNRSAEEATTLESEDDSAEFYDAMETQAPSLPDDSIAVAGVLMSGLTITYPNLPAADAALGETSSERSTAKPASNRSGSARESTKEAERADQWVATYRASLPPEYQLRARDAALRAWHVWHAQRLDCAAVAAALRDPPLARSTVANYILDALKFEDLPFEPARLRAPGGPLALVPDSVHLRYGKVIRRCEAEVL